MTAVPIIASDRGYNGELIEDEVDGSLTHKGFAEELASIIKVLSAGSAGWTG